MIKLPLAITLPLIILLLLPLFCQGRVGYELNVDVNNSTAFSTWSSSFSTIVLSFQDDSACSGEGRSSEYMRIAGFAGINMKENTYAGTGRFIRKDTLSLSSSESWIHIAETGENHSEHYTAVVNSSLPTALLSKSELYYRGAGINTKNEYINNDDTIITNFRGKNLVKSVGYGAIFDKLITYVDITPGSVKGNTRRNFTTAFGLSSTSDSYSGIGVATGDNFIEEIYLGRFKMSKKVVIGHHFEDIKDEEDRLGCISQDLEDDVFSYA